MQRFFFLIAFLLLGISLMAFDNTWSGRRFVTYGNSITAIGNGNHTPPYDKNSLPPWQLYVADYFSFAKHYGRGVGGQTFVWNKGTWWANSDGSYNDRPDGKKRQPKGTTVRLGTFCSWDRITTMIPAEVDLIVVMGGTNDWGSPIGDTRFLKGNAMDSAWANSAYYTGGDFDLTVFKGGVASTVMKIQKWAPKAIVVLCTPLSGRGDESGKNMTDEARRNGMVTSDYVQAMIEVARFMSVPVIDVFSTCGINQFNRADYIPDTVHPYPFDGHNLGNKALARSIISGLRNILPNDFMSDQLTLP